jgi:hypothetical protein
MKFSFLGFLIIITNSYAVFNYEWLVPPFLSNNSLYNGHSYRYQLQVFNLNAELTNNSLSFSDYNYFFYKNPHWNDCDKRNFLSRISGNGLKINSNVSLLLFSFFSRPFNILIYSQNYVNASFAKDIVDVLLFGNRLNHNYNFSGTSLNGLSYIGTAVGFNYQLLSGFLDELLKTNNFLVGIRVHYQHGIFCTQTESIRGALLTTPTNIFLDVKLKQQFLKHGSCVAGDFYTSINPLSNISITFALFNINNGFSWQKNYSNLYELTVDSLNLNHFLKTRTFDSIITYRSYATQSRMKTKIPAQMFICTHISPLRYLNALFYYHQYLKSSVFISEFRHRLSLVFSYHPRPIFSLALGIASDLKKNFYLTNSVDFFISQIHLNLSVSQYGGLFSHMRGALIRAFLSYQW